MKAKNRLLAMLLATLILASVCSPALAVDDGVASTYTYNYDYWSDIRESPDAYYVEDVIYSADFLPPKADGTLDRLNAPESMFVQGNDLYIADTNNNRIIQLTRREDTGKFEFVRIISEIKGAAVNTFNKPADVAVDADKNIYIADRDNQRVVKVDKDLNFLQEFVKPSHATYTVTGPEGYSLSIRYADFNQGEGVHVIENLPIGDYTVTLDEANAQVPQYTMETIGNNATVTVEKGKVAQVVIENVYTSTTGEVETAVEDETEEIPAEEIITEEAAVDETAVAADEDDLDGGKGTLKIVAVATGAEMPANTTFDQKLSFLPNRLVIDVSGRVFTLVTNVNKGIVKFENDGVFTGYVGANKVSFSLYDYIWKNFFMTEAQRAQQESFVPTEYRNLYMDDKSFIYATNTSFSEYDLLYDVAQPIRRLNAVGNDILIKNDHYPPIGDLYWQEQDKGLYGPSKFIDITVLENEIYVALDETRERLFGYDSQGIMLWAFGNPGSSEEVFNNAVALDHMGRDLLVMDQRRGSVTVFKPTEYGTLIYEAIQLYNEGKFDESAQKWEEVEMLNANYTPAFIGIGRALMRKDTYESYQEAMDYFEMAQDRDNYGRAFQLYRKIWVERNIGWIVIILVVVLIVPLILKQIKKRKMEVEEYERNQVAK